jgi:hypothetical protein
VNEQCPAADGRTCDASTAVERSHRGCDRGCRGVAVSNRDATARRWQPKQPARDTAKHLQANPPPRQRIKADLHQRQQLASLSRGERVLLVKLLKKIAPRSAAAQPC